MDAAEEELTGLLYSYIAASVFHTRAIELSSVGVLLRATESLAAPVPRFVRRYPALHPAVVEPTTPLTGSHVPKVNVTP
jgi:hypothetical protein